MQVGDLVRFYQVPPGREHVGCLPNVEDDSWSGHGLVLEVCGGSVNVLWPKEGLQLVDNRFLEVVS